MKSFFFKALIVAVLWLAALCVLLLGWRGAWVPMWETRIALALACWLLAEAAWTMRCLRQDGLDLIGTFRAIAQQWQGPLRQAAAKLGEAVDRLDDAAGDVAETTESFKQRVHGGLLEMFFPKRRG